jgi:hypothetical protein
VNLTETTMNLRLHVLIRRESDGHQEKWLAQCLDYDIAAQGDSLPEVKKRFERTVLGNIILALEHDQVPFAHLLPASAQYHEMWQHATALQDSMPVSLPSDRVPMEARQFPNRVPRGEIMLRVA